MDRRRLILASVASLIMSGTLVQCALMPGSTMELSPAQFAAVRSAFGALISGEGAGPPDGFALRPLDTPFAGMSLAEYEGLCRGGGEYILRDTGPDTVPLLIAAPHRGSDRFTGPLAMRTFVEVGAVAAAWNTVPRNGGPCGAPNSDLARLARHPFTAFTLAFASTYPQGRVVQLHGFHPARRTTAAGRAATMILSNGSDQVTPAVDAIGRCLTRAFPNDSIAIYPTDVSELGARSNVQGQQLRATGFAGFVHVELSLEIRQQLTTSNAMRRAFARCLAVGL
jgi:hypothetical protein